MPVAARLPARRMTPTRSAVGGLRAAVLAVLAVGVAYTVTVESTHFSLPWAGVTFGVLLLSLFSPLLVFVHALPVNMGWAVTTAFLFICKPRQTYDRDLLANSLDYGDDSAWFALPHRQDSADIAPCALTNANGSAQWPCNDEQRGHWRINSQDDLRADVFFLMPTSFYSSANWNASPHDVLADHIVHDDLSPQMASIFNGAGRLFVPRVRQMTAAGFWAKIFMDDDAHAATEALDVAYSDVVQAFRAYRARWAADGRPLIIAGHSQGTAHAMRLLVEEIAPDLELCDLLVAAYLPGMPLFESSLRRALKMHGVSSSCALAHAPICDNSTQVGCVMSWRTYYEGGDPSQFLQHDPPLPSVEWSREHSSNAMDTETAEIVWEGEDEVPLCTNPLTWQVGASEIDDGRNGIGREANLGAMPLFHPHYNWVSMLHAGSEMYPRPAGQDDENIPAAHGQAHTVERHPLNDRILRMEHYYGPLRPHVSGARCGQDGALYASPAPRFWHSLTDLPGKLCSIYHVILIVSNTSDTWTLLVVDRYNRSVLHAFATEVVEPSLAGLWHIVLFPGLNAHSYDYQLFYTAIR